MKKLSQLVLGTSVISLLSLPLTTSAALNDNKPHQQIFVVIGNNSQLPLYNARLKLNRDADWTNIGNIKPGQNNFILNGFLDDEPNLFEAQLANGNWLIGAYEKDHTGKIALNIEASQDAKFKALLQDDKGDVPALSMYSLNTHQVHLMPISAADAYRPSLASCTNVNNDFRCYMANLGLFYYAEGGTLSPNNPYGYFSSELSPWELLQKYGAKGSTTYKLQKSYMSVKPRGAGSFGFFQKEAQVEGKGHFGRAF
jgi:hypothetical protein